MHANALFVDTDQGDDDHQVFLPVSLACHKLKEKRKKGHMGRDDGSEKDKQLPSTLLTMGRGVDKVFNQIVTQGVFTASTFVNVFFFVSTRLVKNSSLQTEILGEREQEKQKGENEE